MDKSKLPQRLENDLWSAFPITHAEADEMHKLDWNSGFGWNDEPDWYWQPSEGDDIFLRDDPMIATSWLSDLEATRTIFRLAREREYGPDMAEILRELVDIDDTASSQVEHAKRIENLISHARNILSDIGSNS